MILLPRNALPSVRFLNYFAELMLKSLIEDEMDVSALNLGMIAAYYNISCRLVTLTYICFD